MIKKAEILIISGFPEKIVKLNGILNTPEFADREFTDVFQVNISFVLFLFFVLI